MTLQPNFLPVGSIVYYNIESIEHPKWTPTKLDAVDLQWLDGDPKEFNIAHRPIPLNPEILTEWCEAKRAKVFLSEYRIGKRLFIFRGDKCFDYGSNIQLDYLHELQLLFLGMKQVLPITIK